MMRNLKKFFSGIVIMSVAIGLCSCSNSSVNENVAKELILVASGDGGTSDVLYEGKSAEECGLYTEHKNIKKTVDDESKTAPFDKEKNFKYQHSRCIMKDGSSDEIGEIYCRYDVYENGKESIEYLHGTDILTLYAGPLNMDTSYPLMEEGQVRKLAEEFLKSIMSDDTFEKFTYSGMSMDVLERYSLIYYRYIEGYKTDEIIAIWINRDGSISVYSSQKLKKYDSIEGTFTREEVDVAKEFLQNKINSWNLQNLECDEPMIVTNTSGELYLEIEFSYTNKDGIGCAESALVKIK